MSSFHSNDYMTNDLISNDFIPNDLDSNVISSSAYSSNDVSPNGIPSSACSLNDVSSNDFSSAGFPARNTMRPSAGFTFWLANLLERWSLELKEKGNARAQEAFFKQYGLTDREQVDRRVTKYNYYGGVNVLMLDELLSRNVMKRDDVILDVGSGTGIFLLYLAAHGFTSLIGQDLDPDLCAHARKNIRAFLSHCPAYTGDIDIRCENAITAGIPDEVNVCYLFNSFYDQYTYEEWLNALRASLERNPRKVKILLLYPTPASLGAFRSCKWLRQVDTIRSDTQICSLCVRFDIFETMLG